MGWFNEQIRQRKKCDNESFFESFDNIASAVLGKKISSALNDDKEVSKNAIALILKYYHVKNCEISDEIKDINEQLEYILRPHGIMRRTVKLNSGWYKDAIGAMIGTFEHNGRVVALIPSGLSGYSYYDIDQEKFIKVNHKNQKLFSEEAISFYKPLPLKKLSVASLIKYSLGTISAADIVLSSLATLAVVLVGLFSPKITSILFSTVIESENIRLLLAIAVFSICVSISSTLFSMVKALTIERLNTKMNLNIQAATMMRVISLPASFFKNYSAGELHSRVSGINSLCTTLVSVLFSTGLTSILSLIYIVQMMSYATALMLPAIIFTLLTLSFMLTTTFFQIKISRKRMKFAGEESGMTYALITGVQKIKLSGAEKRAFARWGNLYAKAAQLTYNPPMFLKLNSVISLAISLTGTLVMYYVSVKSGVSTTDYYAFNTAYSMVSGAFLSLSGIATSVASIKPVLERINPILSTAPEASEGKQLVTRLTGAIELNGVSFRYKENTPYILKNLSIKIRPGQYVAIVGKTGCGKSTLMRLLLGLEKPQTGAVYYDGKDISTLELQSLRRKIGTVMQDSKLFQGDIFSNIIISAPWLTMDDAWKAAELAGIAEDIRRLPMGMHTIISEGSGGISGGQRQRLAIARAIAPGPKILMFDEATSALDNLTQKKVSEALDSLKCTRIVIAHRLSTIQNCDRIIVLDEGKIIEDGTYDQLIAKQGFFAQLVDRQRLDCQ